MGRFPAVIGRVAGEAGLAALDRLINVLGGFLILTLLADRMSRTDFGIYALGTSVFVIISMLPFTPFDQAILRFWSIHGKQGTWKEAVAGVVRLYGGLALAWSLIAVLLRWTPLPVAEALVVGLIPIVTYSLLECFRITLQTIESAKRNRGTVACSSAFVFSCRCAIILLLHAMERLSVPNLFALFCIPSILNAIFLVLKNRADFGSLFATSRTRIREIRRELAAFALPMILWGPFVWAQNMINRWWLEGFHDEHAVAEFTIVNAVATFIPTASYGILWVLMTPILYQRETERKGAARDLNRRVLPAYGVILGAGFLLSLLYSDTVFTLVFTRYQGGAWMLPFLYVPAALIQWASYSTLEVQARMNTRALLLPNILPGLSAIVVGLALIPRLEPQTGVVANSLITGALYFLLITLAVRRERKAQA